MSAVRKEVDRLLRDAWTPPQELPEHDVDLLFVKAYRQIAGLKLHVRRLHRVYGDAAEPETNRLRDRFDDLQDFILSTPAKGLRGAQVKLRVLLDPETGLETGRGEHDTTALKDVSAVIAREMLKRPAHPVGEAKP